MCKSIFWFMVFMKSYPLLQTFDSHWLWQNEMASRSVNIYLGLFGLAIWLFPRRKFIPTKHLRHSGPFPVQWTWMTCLFLNWTWKCDVWSKILNLAIHRQLIHFQTILMITVFWKNHKRCLFLKIMHTLSCKRDQIKMRDHMDRCFTVGHRMRNSLETQKWSTGRFWLVIHWRYNHSSVARIVKCYLTWGLKSTFINITGATGH